MVSRVSGCRSGLRCTEIGIETATFVCSEIEAHAVASTVKVVSFFAYEVRGKAGDSDCGPLGLAHEASGQRKEDGNCTHSARGGVR